MALRRTDPMLEALLDDHRAEFFAGGVAPDAMRLLSGADKPSTHFYDDQRADTWSEVIATIAATHPAVADPSLLAPPSRAWMAGYLAHIASDIAYWHNVLPLLPPFPERASAHHGAWLIADDTPIAPDDLPLDPERVRYDSAPPWIDVDAVRHMLVRLQERILVDGMWKVELAYLRNRPEAAGRSDAELLAEQLPAWERNLEEARALLPQAAWDAFRADAVRRATELVRAYFTPATAAPQAPAAPAP